MEILKYTFIKDNLGVKDGEIVELDPIKIECNFALTLESLGMFEDEYGKPLINVIFGENNEDLGNSEFIKALACSTYIKLDNDKVTQNVSTKEQFKDFEIYKSCPNDLFFVGKLITIATSGIREKINQQAETLDTKKPKN